MTQLTGSNILSVLSPLSYEHFERPTELPQYVYAYGSYYATSIRASTIEGRGWMGKPPQIQLVISYYDEPLPALATLIHQATAQFPYHTTKVTVYHKGLKYGEEGVTREKVSEYLDEWVRRDELEGRVDEVVGLKNEGRDGGTHLTHM